MKSPVGGEGDSKEDVGGGVKSDKGGGKGKGKNKANPRTTPIRKGQQKIAPKARKRIASIERPLQEQRMR